MSSCDYQCDCQESIDDDEATVAATVTEKLIGDGLLMTAVATTAAGIFFGLSGMGMVQNNALIISTTWA